MDNFHNPLANAAIKLVAAIVLLGSSQLAMAEPNDGTFFGKEAKGKWIIGVKGAKIDTNSEFVDDADATGIVLGYEFDRVIGTRGGSSTVELEYITGDETTLDGAGTYEADMLNLFFTYRTAGDLYFKAKAGVSYSELSINAVAFDTTFDEVSLAAGVGLGYHIGEYGSIEIEYVDDTSDNDLGLLGLNALLEF